MLAQRVAHRAQGFVDVGVVRLAADDEQHVRLLQEVAVADARHFLHLLVRRVAAEVGADAGRFAQHFGDQAVGAAAEGRRQDRAFLVDHEDVGLALVRAQFVDFLLERADVRREQVLRQPEPRHARVVAVETALEVASHRRQPALVVGTHADRVQLERRHSVVVQQFPQLGQLLHQRRDDLARRADVGQRVGDDEGLEAGQRVEGHRHDLGLVELLDVDAATVGDRDRRRAIASVVGDREVDLVLGRHAALEGHAVGFGEGVAVAVLGEVEALLLGQRAAQIGGSADQSRLALLADAALEQRLDEDLAVALDQIPDLVFRGVGAEHLGGRKVDVPEQRRPVQKSGQLHE